MNILPASTNGDPVGAAALLGHADPVELERFSALEDAVWGRTTLAPAVIEAVRLHCATIRGCEFCKAVRVTSAVEDGLSEAQIAQLGAAESRGDFDDAQAAALTLVDHFLRDPRIPDHAESAAAALGSSGVMEVLVACCAFASAELRIALGENREPKGSGVVERARGGRIDDQKSIAWPGLDGAVLDPDLVIPGIAPELWQPLHERISALWSGEDLHPDFVAACAVRCSQLHGVSADDAVFDYLVPRNAADRIDADDVRNWPDWPASRGRLEMSLAEQVWMDPAGVNPAMVEPLKASLGVDRLIRVTWQLILIGQLQRLALVLHCAK